MSSTLDAQATGIRSALMASSALTTALGGTAIYYQYAPDEQNYPYVVFSHQAGGALYINPSDIHEDLWFVRAYAKTQTSANTVDALIDAALDKKTLTISGFTNISTVRESDLQNYEIAADKTKTFMSGGLYRIRIDS